MRRLCILFLLPFAFFLLPSARAAEPPLALSASVTGTTLTVVVFTDAPTSAQVRVLLPAGWTADAPLVVNIGVRVAGVLTWRLHPGIGLGIIRVAVADGRGNHAAGRAYAAGAVVESAGPVGARRVVRLAVVRR